MKSNFLMQLAVSLMFIFSFSACSDDGDTQLVPALDGYTKLQEGYAIGAAAKIEIWGEKDFFTGYNKLAVVVYDSLDLSQVITDAAISFEPEMTMDMGGMTYAHTAPVENPQEAENGAFTGAVVFVMPTSDNGSWNLGLHLENNSNQKSGDAEFEVTVTDPDEAVLKSFVAQTSDASKLFVSLLQPQSPDVGINDFELTIHKMESQTSFVSMDDYTVTITPEMPSMGHGSPNNVDPVSSGNGHYTGKVNFTMTGWWRVNVEIAKDGETVSDELYFDITF